MKKFKVLPSSNFESKLKSKGYRIIAGLDEAGRGSVAGPVVAAAVIFPPKIRLKGLADSKVLTSSQREKLFRQIKAKAQAIGVGFVDQSVIDEINILQATFQAFRLAVKNLEVSVNCLLVDGHLAIPNLDLPQFCIIGGDRRIKLIAAASIIAKVTRDRLMIQLDKQYPQYGFAHHKGYLTPFHRQALKDFGPSPIHRYSFRGVII